MPLARPSLLRRLSAAALLLIGTPPVAALANDSEAAIGVGGLALARNTAISMDSEDLYISAEEVRVRYRFTNRTARDQTLTVSFPVPVTPATDDAIYGGYGIPDLDRLQFRTTVNGAPVTLAAVRRAEIGGRDVTARIAALGWPLDWMEASGGTAPGFVTRLSPAQRAAYRREGLLRRTGEDWWPAWSVVTHITRQQLFRAGQTVEVTHRYVPFVGGSVAGMLTPAARGYAGFAEYAAQYCLDRNFLAGFDKGMAAARRRNPDSAYYYESWISYILKPGANWRGPIKDFRLVIDKGKPDRLVSFCMDGVKKISPTQFEVRRRNFEPTRNLDILIVQWAGDEG